MQKLKIQQSGIPAGNYKAKFVGIEPTDHVEFGKGLRFMFEVMEGSCAGMKASRVTAAVPTPINNAGKLMSAMVGRALQADEEIDLTQCLGVEYRVIVEQTKNGTRVQTVMPVM